MKALILLITLSFSFLATTIATPAFAQPNISCSARDRGWEEHWTGHKSCGECFLKHGRCIETCEMSFYTCEAQGKDYQGNAVSTKGTGDDRFEAERNAIRNCQRSFFNCGSVSCNSQNETVSQKECTR